MNENENENENADISDNYDEIIEKISIGELKRFILHRPFFLSPPQKIVLRDYDYFINFIRDNSLFTKIICSNKYKNGKLLLKKLLKVFQLNKVDIDELFEYIKKNGICELKRVSTWSITEIPIICDRRDNEHIKCFSAEFKYINKLGYESISDIYKVLFYNNSIIFIGTDSMYTIFDSKYFIMYNRKLFGIVEEKQHLRMYKVNINLIIEKENDLDHLIISQRNEDFQVDVESFDLIPFFPARFFHRGQMYDKDWREKLCTIKNVVLANGILKIEIENQTYPQSGYIELDLENNNLVKGDAHSND